MCLAIRPVRQGETFLARRGSRLEAALSSLAQYQGLIERLEDLEDSLDLLRAEMDSEGNVPWG